MKRSTSIPLALAWIIPVEAFVLPTQSTRHPVHELSSSTASSDQPPFSFSEEDGDEIDDGGSSSWSVTDDWALLSQADSTVDSSIVFDSEYAGQVAQEMVAGEETATLSEEDVWIRDVVDEIHNAFSTLHEDPPLYDTFESSKSSTNSLDTGDMESEMEREIAMLIRCNEEPESMLMADGKALPPLSKHERDDVRQLVVFDPDQNNSEQLGVAISVVGQFSDESCSDSVTS